MLAKRLLVAAAVILSVNTSLSAPVLGSSCNSVVECLFEKLKTDKSSQDGDSELKQENPAEELSEENEKRMWSRHGKRTQPSIEQVEDTIELDKETSSREIPTQQSDLDTLLQKVIQMKDKIADMKSSKSITTPVVLQPASSSVDQNADREEQLQMLNNDIDDLLAMLYGDGKVTPILPPTEKTNQEKKNQQIYLLSRQLAEIDELKQKMADDIQPTETASEERDSISQASVRSTSVPKFSPDKSTLSPHTLSMEEMSYRIEHMSGLVDKLLIISKLAYKDLQQQIDRLSVRPRYYT